MITPEFYTKEAESADIVQCRSGHTMSREAALFVGKMTYSTWGCPYCTFTPGERQAVFRAREVAMKEC